MWQYCFPDHTPSQRCRIGPPARFERGIYPFRFRLMHLTFSLFAGVLPCTRTILVLATVFGAVPHCCKSGFYLSDWVPSMLLVFCSIAQSKPLESSRCCVHLSVYFGWNQFAFDSLWRALMLTLICEVTIAG